MLIPCSHICAVFTRIDDQLFHKMNLHYRWRLERHPLWEKAHAHLGLECIASDGPSLRESEQSQSAMTMDNASWSHGAITTFNRQLFDEIDYPSRENIQYARLKQIFDAIATNAKGLKHVYKYAISSLTRLENNTMRMRSLPSLVNEHSNSQSVVALAPSVAVRPPPKKRSKGGRISRDDIANRAARPSGRTASTGSKRGSDRHCTDCRRLRGIEVTGHRAKSSKCPLFRVSEVTNRAIDDENTMPLHD